ncbi:MAG: HK97 family phage prohead protease [Candidatus Hydrogenedentes bacterium]|nr:HK97 family phage prohead protease [Candidatus Hydrogenedentota bacterium]
MVNYDSFGGDTNPIGVWTDIKETKDALEMTGQLALKTQRGSETHELLKLGALDGLSIGFQTVKSETDEETDVRTLTEINLWEVSVVTFPAAHNARISTVKSFHLLSQEERNSLQDILKPIAHLCETERDFEAFLRDAGWSRKEAETIVSKGFKGLLSQGEPDDKELASLAAAIRKTANVLNPQGD